MASLTIKNIPDELYEQIKQSAVIHRRSINSELIVGLEKAFHSVKADAAQHISAAREIRETLANYHFDSDDIQAAKQEGRP